MERKRNKQQAGTGLMTRRRAMTKTEGKERKGKERGGKERTRE